METGKVEGGVCEWGDPLVQPPVWGVERGEGKWTTKHEARKARSWFLSRSRLRDVDAGEKERKERVKADGKADPRLGEGSTARKYGVEGRM